MVSMCRLVIMGFAMPLTAALQAPAGMVLQRLCAQTATQTTMGRRSLLVGAAAALTASIQPANALTSSEMEEAMNRAKNNQLSTDGVIFRAYNDDLIDPDAISGCKNLEEIYKIDSRAAQEVRIANDVLLKLNAAEKKNGWRSSLPSRVNPNSIEDSYEIGRIIEQRISSRASAINVKISLDCQMDPASAYKEGPYGVRKSNDSPYRSKDEFRLEDRKPTSSSYGGLSDYRSEYSLPKL
mmetsp:Transcript_1761/g.4995  ORF Transcript_1761/g.4995 Transcript_1761/m.4995 type:complete len:239 (-) Transcript_1761:350-1066(-)